MKLIAIVKDKKNKLVLVYLDKKAVDRSCYYCIYNDNKYCTHVFPGAFYGCLSHVPEGIRRQIYEICDRLSYVTFSKNICKPNLFISLSVHRFLKESTDYKLLAQADQYEINNID